MTCRWSWCSIGQCAGSWWYRWIEKHRRGWGWRIECPRRALDTPTHTSALINSASRNHRSRPNLLQNKTHRQLVHGIVKVVAILADRILVCNIGFIDHSTKTELSCFAYRLTEILCHSRIVTYLGYPTNGGILYVKFFLFETFVASTEFEVRLSKGCRSLLFQGMRNTIPIFLGFLLTPSPVSSCRWSWFNSKSRCWPKEKKNKIKPQTHVHKNTWTRVYNAYTRSLSLVYLTIIKKCSFISDTTMIAE